jgi:hypothetical protein
MCETMYGLGAAGNNDRRSWSSGALLVLLLLTELEAVSFQIFGRHLFKELLALVGELLPALRDHATECGKVHFTVRLAVTTLLGAIAVPVLGQHGFLFRIRIVFFATIENAIAFLTKKEVVGRQCFDRLQKQEANIPG